MAKFHAIMGGFCGEFSVEIVADSVESAVEILNENYEESSVFDIGDSSYWNEKQVRIFNGGRS
jgi:hypothetical protein